MFLFNSNHGNDPISFPDHPFFHFPSPFDDEDLLLQQPQHASILLHDHHQPVDETPAIFVNMVDSEYSNRINVVGDHEEQQIQRKKGSSKRDRHSKINTLRGPRDRRMRLSLPVAREFFGLQDLLGVDKASKTVEWLLLQARHAIKKLSGDQSCHNDGGGGTAARSVSSVSDSEVVSGIDETAVDNTMKQGGRKTTTTKEKRGRLTRKTVFHPLARECREKARARARARTREKQLQIIQKLKPNDHHVESTKQDLSKITSSWSTQIETGEESAATTQINEDHQPPINSHPRSGQLGTTDRRIFDDNQDDSLMIMGRWSPSSNSIYQSLHNNNGIPQEHPFGDFQLFGKPWEAYNNHGIC